MTLAQIVRCTLADIVRFIQHKISSCDKDLTSYHCYSAGKYALCIYDILPEGALAQIVCFNQDKISVVNTY